MNQHTNIMIRFSIDFNGYIDVDKEDLSINTINEETGGLEPVDVTELSADEIKEGILSGLYYIDFKKCYDKALDGQENYVVDFEEE